MKRNIDVWQYAGTILDKLGKGILLTTQAGGKVNTMVIGWGTLGIEWGKPIFTAYVRESRFTKELLDANPVFTVNVPLEAIDKEVLRLCGSKSGRELDKFAALGLHTEPGETVDVPAIRELPLTLECKVIYKQDQDPAAIEACNIERYYPPFFPDGRGDYHTVYYGQITAAYIVE